MKKKIELNMARAKALEAGELTADADIVELEREHVTLLTTTIETPAVVVVEGPETEPTQP